jgi:hypothetical protein
MNYSLFIHLIISTIYTTPLVLTLIFNDSKQSQIISDIAAYMACSHLGFVFSTISIHYIQRVAHPLLCLYNTSFTLIVSGCYTFVLAMIYNFCVPIFHHNEIFATAILLTIYTTLISSVYTGTCVFLYITHHKKTFQNILAYEQAMTFVGVFKDVAEVIDSSNNETLRNFIAHWKTKSDDEIMSSIEAKTSMIFNTFVDHIDQDGDKQITYEEFITFAHNHKIYDTELLWNIFSNHSDIKCINTDVISSMLYHTLFNKKHFANALNTDVVLAKWMTSYLFLFSFPLVCIILSSIWSFTTSFEGSVSIFQIYILVATFGLNKLASNISFITYMAIVRPFNIGELLFIDNDLYKVSVLSPTYVLCIGKDTIVLRNSQMLDNYIKNYSRSFVYDSISLEFPLNTHDDLALKVYAKMIEYASENWMDIKKDSMRCGWVTIKNGNRILQCNWVYNFKVYDRSLYNRTRTKFVNSLIQSTINDASQAFILFNAAQGTVVLNPMLLNHFNSFQHKIVS